MFSLPSFSPCLCRRLSGLGLAVVARIIEQLGGQLRVDSKPGQGSTFSFLIPFGLHDPASDSRTQSVGSSVSGSQDSRQQSDLSSVNEIAELVEVLTHSQISKSQFPIQSQVRPSESKKKNHGPSWAGSPPGGVKLRILVVDVRT